MWQPKVEYWEWLATSGESRESAVNWLRILLVSFGTLGPLSASVRPTSAADADAGGTWLSGVALERKLAAPASVLWSDHPLRQSLMDFGRAQQIAAYVDRRINPDTKLALAVRDLPVLEVFREATRDRGIGVAVLGDVIYVAPDDSARRVRTVAEGRRRLLQKLGEEASRRFAQAEPFAWEDFATPRGVLQQLAQDHGLQIVDLERVPHDLWPAADLPPMTLVDRLTLVLEQFGLTFEVSGDGSRIRLVPIPGDVSIVRHYPGGSRAKELVEKWRHIAPECRFEVVADRIHVKGLLEDHERIEQSRRPTTGERSPRGAPRPAGRAEQVFTAHNVNVPLGAVLNSFAGQLGLELRIDREGLATAGVALDQLISFEVEQVSFDQLLDAVLQPVGCTHERRGNELFVRAAR